MTPLNILTKLGNSRHVSPPRSQHSSTPASACLNLFVTPHSPNPREDPFFACRTSKLAVFAVTRLTLPQIDQSRESTAEVRLEDQKQINRFSILNNRKLALEEDIERTKARLANLKDATVDVEEIFDDAALFQAGSAFFEFTPEVAGEHAAALHQRVAAQLAETVTKHAAIVEEMDTLKKALYGRFGRSINLD
jgi:prefoldin subunit 4